MITSCFFRLLGMLPNPLNSKSFTLRAVPGFTGLTITLAEYNKLSAVMIIQSFHVFSLVMISHPLKEFTVCGIIIVSDNDIASQNKELTDDKNDHTNE